MWYASGTGEIVIAVWHAVNTAWGPLSFIASLEAWEAGVEQRRESPERKAQRRKIMRVVQGRVPEMLERRYVEMVACHDAAYTDPMTDPAFQIAFAKFQDAMQYHAECIMSLHARECNCTWTPDNTDIFKLERPHGENQN